MEVNFSKQFSATNSSSNQPNLIRRYSMTKHGMVKLSLCSIKHHTMKAYMGVEVQLLALFPFALNKGEL
jgi:hypothetical protein